MKKTKNTLAITWAMNIKLNHSLHIMLPKTSVHLKSYDGQTKWMNFLIKDDDLWENTIIQGKVGADIK